MLPEVKDLQRRGSHRGCTKPSRTRETNFTPWCFDARGFSAAVTALRSLGQAERAPCVTDWLWDSAAGGWQHRQKLSRRAVGKGFQLHTVGEGRRNACVDMHRAGCWRWKSPQVQIQDPSKMRRHGVNHWSTGRADTIAGCAGCRF